MFPSAQARTAAERLVIEIEAHCHRLLVAGSIRREKAFVKDLELVVLPTPLARTKPGTLFEEEQTDELTVYLEEVVSAGRHRRLLRPTQQVILKNLGDGRTEQAKRASPWGPAYKRLWWTWGEVTYPVDLFIATPETWGPLCAIRTGPSDFSQRMVTQQPKGAMPPHKRQHGGRLQQRTGQDAWEDIDTPDEAAWFNAIGVPFWGPRERTDAKLCEFLRRARKLPARPAGQSSYAPFRQEARGCSY